MKFSCDAAVCRSATRKTATRFERTLTHLVAVPVSAAFCGEPLASSAALTAAVNVPATVGLNVTVIMQLAPAAKPEPHVLVCKNEVLLVPDMLIPFPVPLRLIATVPVLVSFIC